jgi:hypothetical protein
VLQEFLDFSLVRATLEQDFACTLREVGSSQFIVTRSGPLQVTVIGELPGSGVPRMVLMPALGFLGIDEADFLSSLARRESPGR